MVNLVVLEYLQVFQYFEFLDVSPCKPTILVVQQTLVIQAEQQLDFVGSNINHPVNLVMDSELVKVAVNNVYSRFHRELTKDEFNNLAQNIFQDLLHIILKQPDQDDYKLVLSVNNFVEISEDPDCAKFTNTRFIINLHVYDQVFSTTHAAPATLVSVTPTLVLCAGHININDNCFLVMDNDLRVS